MNVTATTNAAQARPTLDQVATMFLAVAAKKLESLESIRNKDTDWLDADVSVDMAIELVSERVQAMSGTMFPSADAFAGEWYKISSVVNLSMASFSRPSSWYGRTLQDAAQFFQQVPDILHYAEVGVA